MLLISWSKIASLFAFESFLVSIVCFHQYFPHGFPLSATYLFPFLGYFQGKLDFSLLALQAQKY